MILQYANIVSGFVLAAPKLKTFGAKAHIEKAEGVLAPYKEKVGLVVLALGLVGLLIRIGVLPFYFWWSLGSSFPQVIPAIASGLILSARFFEQYTRVYRFIAKIKPYEVEIGIAGILVGLGSLLFGCVTPFFCGGMYY